MSENPKSLVRIWDYEKDNFVSVDFLEWVPFYMEHQGMTHEELHKLFLKDHTVYE
jgi:hypothetical protein